MKKRLIISLLFTAILAGCSTSSAETVAETSAAVAETPVPESSAEAETAATESKSGNTEETAVTAGGLENTGRNEAFVQYLTEVKTNQYFEDTPVPAEDARMILQAGVNAQSGMNMQSWHFTAVTSHDILQQIADDMSAGLPAGAMDGTQKAGIADAPLVIIVSCGEGKDYDAGLATQAMNSAALALGYGTKIVSSPSIALNGEKQEEYKKQLGIPDDMAFVGAILIGEAADTATLGVDAVTGATTRNDFSEMATFVD